MVVIKKSKRTIDYLVIHCTATKEGYPFNAKDIDRWHKSKGWKGIGYNYVIKLDGTIELGRDVNEVPAHVEGHNSNSIGIVYVGGFDDNMTPKDTRTPQQKEAMKYLVGELKKVYRNAEVLGHRDFPNVKKACPSFEVKKEFK